MNPFLDKSAEPKERQASAQRALELLIVSRKRGDISATEARRKLKALEHVFEGACFISDKPYEEYTEKELEDIKNDMAELKTSARKNPIYDNQTDLEAL